MIRKFIGDRAFYRRTLSIMLPILVQNVITNFVSLLDNLMVGQVGTEPMSGVAIVNELIFVFNICVFGCIEGADIFTAQFYGKGDLEGVRSSFRLKLLLLLLNFLCFSAVFAFFGDRLIGLFITEGSGDVDTALTFAYARKYLRIALWQMLPFSLVQLYSGTLKCSGETVVPMKAGITAVCVNALFNWLLIFGKCGLPKMGVEGAALATVLSKFVELSVVVLWTHSHKKEADFIDGAYSTLRVEKTLAKRIIRLGLPLLFNEIFWSVGTTILSQSYSTRGIDVVPAVNITNTVFNLFCCGLFAMGNTIAIIIGNRLGAGELQKAVEDDNRLIAMSFLMCVFVCIVLFFAAPFIPLAYNTTEGVRQLAGSMLRICALIMPIMSLGYSFYFTLRSGGKTLYTVLFDSCFVWVVQVPVAVALSRLSAVPILPLYGIVQAVGIIKALLGFVLVNKKVWVNNLVG